MLQMNVLHLLIALMPPLHYLQGVVIMNGMSHTLQ